jgi:hypothetical protein
LAQYENANLSEGVTYAPRLTRDTALSGRPTGPGRFRDSVNPKSAQQSPPKKSEPAFTKPDVVDERNEESETESKSEMDPSEQTTLNTVPNS